MGRSGPAGSVLTLVGLLVVLGAVLPFVAFAVPQTIGADHSYVVMSSSMRPTFEAGDAIFVRGVDPATIEEGDVITYREGTAEVIENNEVDFITHRVTEVIETDDGRLFRTQGDANDGPDPQAVAPRDVTGQVWFTLPFMGHIVAFATTETGVLVMVALPLSLLIVSESYDLARAAWHDRAKLERILASLGKRLGSQEEDH